MALVDIFQVAYSEQVGYYCEVVKQVEQNAGNWREVLTTAGTIYLASDGWRETEDDAVQFWRDAGVQAAADMRELASEIETTALNRTPTIPDKILKPGLV